MKCIFSILLLDVIEFKCKFFTGKFSYSVTRARLVRLGRENFPLNTDMYFVNRLFEIVSSPWTWTPVSCIVASMATGKKLHSGRCISMCCLISVISFKSNDLFFWFILTLIVGTSSNAALIFSSWSYYVHTLSPLLWIPELKKL